MKETGKVRCVEQVATFLVNEEKFKDPRNVTNAFNNFFIMITEKYNIQQNRERRHYLNCKRNTSWKHPQHKDNPHH